MAAAATPEQIRLIIEQTLGRVGPQIQPDGQVAADGANRPTLLEKLKKPDIPKPPGPTVFSGIPEENPVEWRDRISDYIAHAGYVEDDDQLRIVRMYLKGRAAVWYKHLEDDHKDNLENFLEAFNAKFLEGESKYSAQQALYTRRQLPGEAPEKYIEDVLVKADMLNWPQEQTLQHLIGGLQDSLKPYVIMANPGTLEGTCDIILRAHNANKANMVNQGLPGIQSALTEILTQVKSDKGKKSSCAILEATPAPPPPVQTQQSPRRPPRQPPPPAPAAQTPIIINTMQPQSYPRPRQRFPRRFTQ